MKETIAHWFGQIAIASFALAFRLCPRVASVYVNVLADALIAANPHVKKRV